MLNRHDANAVHKGFVRTLVGVVEEDKVALVLADLRIGARVMPLRASSDTNRAAKHGDFKEESGGASSRTQVRPRGTLNTNKRKQ
jgi:hypothetical protein